MGGFVELYVLAKYYDNCIVVSKLFNNSDETDKKFYKYLLNFNYKPNIVYNFFMFH